MDKKIKVVFLLFIFVFSNNIYSGHVSVKLSTFYRIFNCLFLCFKKKKGCINRVPRGRFKVKNNSFRELKSQNPNIEFKPEISGGLTRSKSLL